MRLRSPLQKYQYNVVEPETSSAESNSDFSSYNQNLYPYGLPGFRPDLNIGNESWNATKMFGAPNQDEAKPSDKWTNFLNKVYILIFHLAYFLS